MTTIKIVTSSFKIKNLSKLFLHAIFFPLIAVWMFWKGFMASKKEILDDLARYREKSDVIYNDLYSVSTKALEIMSQFEKRLHLSMKEEDQMLLAEIHKFAELVMDASNNANDYGMSLMQDYGQALKKIGNS